MESLKRKALTGKSGNYAVKVVKSMLRCHFDP